MWEILFKYPRTAFGSGELIFTNVQEPMWWWAGSFAAVAVIGISAAIGSWTRKWSWWQKVSIGVLQSAVALGVIALIAGPGLKLESIEPGANKIAVMADVSGSMDFSNDTTRAQSRFEAAQQMLSDELMKELAPLADVVLFGFDTNPARTEDQFDISGANTHLVASADAVLSSFKGVPLAAVIVLSDGADNDTGAAAGLAAVAAHGVPVHTIGFGPAAVAGETQLTDVYLPGEASPNSTVTAEAIISHTSAGSAVIKVRDGGRLIAAQPVTLAEDTPIVRAELHFDSGDAGIRELTFELEPPEGDQFEDNNSQARLLTVAERTRRVLYLEGQPRWEYKFLRRALAGDDVIDLVSWLKTTDRKTYRQGVASAAELESGFPATRAELYGFDVVVLGSLDATELDADQHEWLEAFVSERGGSLLALAGRHALEDGRWDAYPLADALPVHLERDRAPTYTTTSGTVRPTTLGEHSPYIQLVDAEGDSGWRSLPALADLQRLGDLKPAATTLLELAAEGETHPLLVLQPYGRGTAAVLATATTWRWQMRTPPEDPRHSMFWRQLLRQLAETAQSRTSVDLQLDEDGILLRARFLDELFSPQPAARARAVITEPDRRTTAVTLAADGTSGTLAARYVPSEAGVHRVDFTLEGEDGASETVTRFIRAGALAREQFNPVRNEAMLRRLAETTGGRYYRDGDTSDLVDRLRFESAGVRRVTVLPAWNLPAWFFILAVLKLSEWALRRHWGRI